MKVAFIQPSIRRQVWAGVPDVVNREDSHLFPPLSLMYLSAYVKSHTDAQCAVADFRLDNPSEETMKARIAAMAPDLVVMTANSHDLVNTVDVIKAVRASRKDAFILIGGPHANAFPDMAARLPGIDAAIRGDGEKPLTALIVALASGGDITQIPGLLKMSDAGEIVRGPQPQWIENLDDLPFPDRSWMPKKRYYTPGMRMPETTTMMASRGCPFNCIFCSVPHRFRIRGVENVVEEMLECEKKYGVQEVHFVDDLFNITDRRLIEFSEEVLRRGVKIIWGFKGSPRAVSKESLKIAARAGCVRAHYGVETYTPEGLKALGKVSTIEEIKRAFALTNAEGIRTIAYMIIGSPHEKTMEQVTGCVPFIRDLKPDYVVYSLFSPYPESKAFQLGVERGLWEADVWEKFMLNPAPDYDLPTAWTEHLTKDELVKAFRKVNYAFYAHPATLWRTFTRIRTWPELKRIIKGGLSLVRLAFLKVKGHAI